MNLPTKDDVAAVLAEMDTKRRELTAFMESAEFGNLTVAQRTFLTAQASILGTLIQLWTGAVDSETWP